MSLSSLPLFGWFVACCLLGGVAGAQTFDVWFGTVTSKTSLSKGIYHARFDSQSGRLSTPQLAAEVASPGFLTLHPTLSILYSVGSVEGEPSVVAYRFDSDNAAELEFINSQRIGDGGAAHLSTDHSGSVLLTAQYGGGSTALFPLADDGVILPRVQLEKHSGAAGVVAGNQDAPHAHWTGFSPDNRFAFVPDLGMDKVVIWRFDASQSPPRIEPHGFGVCPPGSGPRHMKFHPNGKWIYVLNELGMTVTLFAYDASAGEMTPLQTTATLSEQQQAGEIHNSTSEVRLHPSGRFVYTANRGHDTITVFRSDPETGFLTLVEQEPIRGSWPRNFNLDPSGRWLLAAGQESNTVAVFEINQQSGQLTYARSTAMVPSPICVLFGRAE